MNNGNSGYSSSNQGGYSSTGSQQASGGGYSSSNQSGPSSSGGYHSSGNHQQITYSSQSPLGFFSPNTYQHREYVVHERYRDDVCCTII